MNNLDVLSLVFTRYVSLEDFLQCRLTSRLWKHAADMKCDTRWIELMWRCRYPSTWKNGFRMLRVNRAKRLSSQFLEHQARKYLKQYQMELFSVRDKIDLYEERIAYYTDQLPRLQQEQQAIEEDINVAERALSSNFSNRSKRIRLDDSMLMLQDGRSE